LLFESSRIILNTVRKIFGKGCIDVEKRACKIRAATVQDAQKLLEIYVPYVENTAVTFEYEVPSVQEFADRIRTTLEKYPYLVAEIDGEIVGYAYAGAFHSRAAYQWAAESSIYVCGERKRQGIGRMLYEALEQILVHQNILNLNACIACADEEDAYLTHDSIRFHQHLGYQMVGKFHQCGYKFGRWYHMVWMEKHIGSHGAEPEAVKSFDEVREKCKERWI
jgi:phosphinothricin acetyltransferase